MKESNGCNPMECIGKSEERTSAVLCLASDDSSSVTGNTAQ